MLGGGGEMERKFVRFASTCHRTDQPGKSGNISILVQSLGHRFLGETRDSPPRVTIKERESSPFLPGEVRERIHCRERHHLQQTPGRLGWYHGSLQPIRISRCAMCV